MPEQGARGMSRFVAPQFVKLLGPKMAEHDRRKRYVPPEPAEVVLQRMQENLAKTEFESKPIPGANSVNYEKMTRAQLQAELEALREAEEWTGLPMKKQKLEIKKLIKAMPKDPAELKKK